IVVGQPEMRLAVADPWVRSQRLLDQWAPAGEVADPEPGGPEVVRGLGHLRRAGVRELEVRESAGRLPGLDQQTPEIGPRGRVMRIRRHGPAELSDREPPVHGPWNAEKVTGQVPVPCGQYQEDGHESDERIPCQPREDTEEKEAAHRLRI